jgi:hypothetical protein
MKQLTLIIALFCFSISIYAGNDSVCVSYNLKVGDTLNIYFKSQGCEHYNNELIQIVKCKKDFLLIFYKESPKLPKSIEQYLGSKKEPSKPDTTLNISYSMFNQIIEFEKKTLNYSDKGMRSTTTSSYTFQTKLQTRNIYDTASIISGYYTLKKELGIKNVP